MLRSHAFRLQVLKFGAVSPEVGSQSLSQAERPGVPLFPCLPKLEYRIWQQGLVEDGAVAWRWGVDVLNLFEKMCKGDDVVLEDNAEAMVTAALEAEVAAKGTSECEGHATALDVDSMAARRECSPSYRFR